MPYEDNGWSQGKEDNHALEDQRTREAFGLVSVAGCLSLSIGFRPFSFASPPFGGFAIVTEYEPRNSPLAVPCRLHRVDGATVL